MGDKLKMQAVGASSPAPQEPQGDAKGFQERIERITQMVLNEGLGSIDSVRGEVDKFYRIMVDFHTMEPDEVMQHCSAISARLSEIRGLIGRIEDFHSHWKTLRIREIDPAMDQAKHQYEIASRRLTSRQHDWDMSKGQPS